MIRRSPCSPGTLPSTREIRVRRRCPEVPVGPRHPLLACADAIEAALKDVAGVDPAFMPTGDKAEVLRRLDRLGDQVAALRMRVMANADDVAESTADPNVATWLAAETHTDPRDRSGELALAQALDRRWTRLAAAVLDGSVALSQARIIASSLEDLPETEVGPEGLARAEEALIGYAGEHAAGVERSVTFAVGREARTRGDSALDLLVEPVRGELR